MIQKRLFFLIITVLFISLGSAAFPGYPGSEDAVVKAVEMVEPSVVYINTITSSGSRNMGSGVIITGNGWIVTNAHVTRRAARIFVTANSGKTYEAVLWRAQPVEDIAVIKIDASGLPVAPMGDSNQLKKGQIAVAIGNPWRFTSTVTVGCISGVGRNLKAVIQSQMVVLEGLIQTDAAINPGNSGGALVNSAGQVVGINTLVYTGARGDYAQGLSFAIPINRAMKLAREMIDRKEAVSSRPWLGVSVARVTPEMNLPVKSGAVIVGFPPNSPARASGLLVGDIIIAINDMPVRSLKDFQSVLLSMKPGQTVVIIVVRNGKKYRARIVLEGIRQ